MNIEVRWNTKPHEVSDEKGKIRSTIMIAAVAIGLSCQNVESPLAEPEVDLVGPTWQLTAFVEADGDHIPVDRNTGNIPEHAYTLTFTQRPAKECIINEKYGHGAWCIELTGYPNVSPSTTYNLNPQNDQALIIYFRGTTLAGRPSGSKEDEFFGALDTATNYRINGTQLKLFYGDEGKVLLFEPLDSE